MWCMSMKRDHCCWKIKLKNQLRRWKIKKQQDASTLWKIVKGEGRKTVIELQK